MRISDSLRYKLFQMNVSKVGKQLDDITTKISTQKNINTPSDDPIKYATSVQYDAKLRQGAQYNNNLQRLSTLVSMYDTSFTSLSSQLDNVMQMAINYDSMGTDLQQSATELVRGVIEQLVTVGNSKIGNSYIFGGQQADAAPFQLNNDYSVTYMVNQQGEDATKIFVDTAQTSQYGISGRQAFFDTNKIAFGDVTNTYKGNVYSNTDSFAYVIDGTNNTINMNGATVTLTSGIYTGGSLAKEIERQMGTLYVINDTNNTFYLNGAAVTLSNGTYSGAALATQVATRLGAGYAVAYNGANKTFSVTNNTGAYAAFNWSNAGATAADILGFNRQDSVVANLGSDASDHSVADFTSVAFDSTTRKFSITNNTGANVTFNWSAGSTAANVLGFGAIDSVVASGATEKSDLDAGRKSFLVQIVAGGSTVGAFGSRATYRFSIDGGTTFTGPLTVNTGGADGMADIVISGGPGPNQNNTFLVTDSGGAHAIALTAGTYTGSTLAAEIQNQLGVGYMVDYNASTRRFTINNTTNSVAIINWSNSLSTAAGVLGFDNVDSVLSSGANDVGDYDAGMFIDGAGVVNTTNNRVKLLFSTTADIAKNDGSFNLYNGTNDTFSVTEGGVNRTITLTEGTYTGARLAEEIKSELGADYSVNYDSSTGKFGITNNTTGPVTFNWLSSDAAAILGFYKVDTVVNSGANVASDYDASLTTDQLVAGDTFQVKDLSVFELLKNLKDAFESGNSTWITKNMKYLDEARALTTKNNSIIAFQGTLAKTMIDSNKTKSGQIQTLQSDLVNADMTELATEFNALLNTYQALLSTLAKMQAVNILNYLK